MMRPAQQPGLSALVALLVALSGGAARADTTFALTLTDAKYKSLSRADCLLDPQESSGFVGNWTGPALSADQESMVFISRTSSCSESTTGTPPDAMILRGRASRTTLSDKYPADNSNELLTARKLFDFVAADCGGSAGIDTAVYLCVKIFTPSTGVIAASTAVGSVAIQLDSAPPATPTEVTTSALDSGLNIGWSMPTDLLGAARYAVRVIAPDGTDKGATISGSATRAASIDGLENGQAYTVSVVAYDSSGTTSDRANVSAPSVSVVGTPQPVQDFFERYRQAGGKESGGCSTGAVSLIALLGLAALRRRREAVLGVGMALLLTTQTARAQDDITPSFAHSPRRFSAWFTGGTYAPDIDSEPGLNGATPYKDIFGDTTSPLWRLGIDADLFSGFGRLSVGLTGGYWNISGKARLASDTTVQTEDTVDLTLWPLTPILTYRADFLWERLHIPLVPYGRLGYGFVRWSSGKNGTTSTFDGQSAEGWARGFEYGLGLQLILDALEPDKAAGLDQDFGINSTSLFFAFDGMNWKGAGGLDLSSTSLGGGLLLAF